jgi:hypothetical protein
MFEYLGDVHSEPVRDIGSGTGTPLEQREDLFIGCARAMFVHRFWRRALGYDVDLPGEHLPE